MKELFQIPATIGGIQTMSDKGLKLAVYTQELNPEEAVKVFSLKDKIGWMVFSESNVQESDIKLDDLPSEIKGDKSPSKRLRDRMAVYYKDSRGSMNGFNSFYEENLDNFGQKFLDKIK